MSTAESKAPCNRRHNRTNGCIWALHGFGGSESDFNALSHHLSLAPIDLLGHGSHRAPSDPAAYSTDAQVAWLAQRVPSHPVRLLGYSMGGRLALQFATRYPERISALVLIGAHPGLRTEDERRQRKQWDDEQSRRILALGTADFMTEWAQLPLIATQKVYMPETDYRAMQARRHSNLEAPLAASLRGFGSGTMPSCWATLKRITAPTLLIAGRDDERYQKMNTAIADHLPHVQTEIVERSGHAPHLSNPEMTATIIDTFLRENEVPE